MKSLVVLDAQSGAAAGVKVEGDLQWQVGAPPPRDPNAWGRGERCPTVWD